MQCVIWCSISFYLWWHNAGCAYLRTGAKPLQHLTKGFFTSPFWKLWCATCDLKRSALLAIEATISLSQAAQKSVAHGRHVTYPEIWQTFVSRVVTSQGAKLSILFSPHSSSKARGIQRFFVSGFHTIFLFLICLLNIALMYLSKKICPRFFFILV